MIGKKVRSIGLGKGFPGGQAYIEKGAAEIDGRLEVEYINLASRETAAAEMTATASMSTRSRQPMLHIVISWPEDEEPDFKKILEAEKILAKKLKLEKHQRIVAAHRPKKGNHHAHVIYNKVNPESLRTVELTNDYVKIVEAMREIEIKQGWSHTLNGPSVVREIETAQGKEKVIVRNPDKNRQVSINSRARDFEAHHNEKSFQTWVGEEPAKAVKEALKNPSCNWQTVHQTLSTFNIYLELKGTGMIVRHRRDGKLTAKASQMARELSRSALEKRLGVFKEPNSTASPQKPLHDYKRDPDKRLIQREVRDTARDKLLAEYDEYKNIHLPVNRESWKKQRESEEARKKELKELGKMQRDRELSRSFKGKGKALNTRRSVLAFEAARRSEQLKQEIKAERAQLDKVKVLSLRDWLKIQVDQGNRTAESVLRGFRYRDKKSLDIIYSLEPAQRPDPGVTFRTMKDIRWKELDNGTVEYRFNEEKSPAFIDTGSGISVHDSRADSLKSALLLASEKWNNSGIMLKGSKEFIDKALKIAVENNVKVDNPELQQRIAMMNIRAAGMNWKPEKNPSPPTPTPAPTKKPASKKPPWMKKNNGPER